MQTRPFLSLFAALAFALGSLPGACGAEDVSVVTFTDPAKPGTLRVSLARGSLRVKGTDAAEVTVKSDSKAINPKAVRKDGLRVLSAASSFSLVEMDNVILLEASLDGGKGGGDFTVTAPRNTALVVTNAWGGDIACANLSGDIEIHSLNGSVTLDDVSGGVVVESLNGEIRAGIRELHDNKPLSFQSNNGEVVLRLPAEAKANVRLRTQNGVVFTDFEENILVTKTETAPVTGLKARGVRATAATGPKGAAMPTPPSPPSPAAADLPEAPPAPKAPAAPKGDNHWDEARAAARAAGDAARAANEATRAALKAAQEGMAQGGLNLNFKGPLIAIPTLNGGKLVTGTLNGGGPEISVATLNGDVTLRKMDKK
jgi:hypothetical protein